MKWPLIFVAQQRAGEWAALCRPDYQRAEAKGKTQASVLDVQDSRWHMILPWRYTLSSVQRGQGVRSEALNFRKLHFGG